MNDPSPEDLAAILDPFIGQKGAIIDALKAIQASFGFVSESAIGAVADWLGVSRNTVYGVASFYEQFLLEPPAKNVVRYCLATTCDALGGRKILEEVSRILGIRVGEESADGEWAIERLPCFGTCARAPMMQINDEAFNNLTIEKVREIFRDRRPASSGLAPSNVLPTPVPEEIEA